MEAWAKAQCWLDAVEAQLQYRCGSKVAVSQTDRGGDISVWIYHHTQPLYSHGEFGKPTGQVRWGHLRNPFINFMCFNTDFYNILFFCLWRVNYLKSKNFSLETVASMVSRAPYLLNFSVKRLDNRLGFFQNQLKLSTSNVSIVKWCRKNTAMFEA